MAILIVSAGMALAGQGALAQAKPPAPAAPAAPAAGAPAAPTHESGIKIPASGFPALHTSAAQVIKGPGGGATGPCSGWTSTLTKTNPDAIAPNGGDFGSIFTNASFGAAGTSPVPTFFGRTFAVPKPPACCSLTSAVLTVTYFARIPGGSVGGANSSNDTGGLVEAGNFVPGSYGFIGGGTAPALWGPTKTISYIVPPSIIASGTVSFQASDNATVISATLKVDLCCT